MSLVSNLMRLVFIIIVYCFGFQWFGGYANNDIVSESTDQWIISCINLHTEVDGYIYKYIILKVFHYWTLLNIITDQFIFMSIDDMGHDKLLFPFLVLAPVFNQQQA